MATEYKLSYTASEIDERLGKIDRIEELQQQISPLVAVKGTIVNLFDKDSAENVDGYLLDSTPVALAGHSYSHKIPVEMGKTYFITHDNNIGKTYCALFYSSTDKYITKATIGTITEENGFRSFVIPSAYGSIEYMRVSYYTTNAPSFMVVQSDCAPTQYVPYGITVTEYEAQKEWTGKKWVCIGDSLTEVNMRTDLHYFDYISEKTGISVVNMGISGTGYKSRDGEDDNGDSFYQRVSKIPTDADVITIFGSGNDCYVDAELGNVTDTGTTTVCGCINTTLDNIFALMPTARVGLVTPTPWNEFNPAVTDNEMKLYSNAIVEICKLRGIPCLDLYHCSGLRPWEEAFRNVAYTKDPVGTGCHPDETGHAIIAPHFKAFLNTLIL